LLHALDYQSALAYAPEPLIVYFQIVLSPLTNSFCTLA
jgi:hypothetical protein